MNSQRIFNKIKEGVKLPTLRKKYIIKTKRHSWMNGMTVGRKFSLMKVADATESARSLIKCAYFKF